METSFQNGVYYKPGNKVFVYFLGKRISIIIVVFVALAIGINYLEKLLPKINIGLHLIIGIGLIFCIISFLFSWIKYGSIKFMLDEFAFHIQKGIMAKSDIAIPYRQIRSVNHSQSMNEKMFGIMHLTVQTVSETEDKDASWGILPILDIQIAMSLEQEILKRTVDK